MQEERDQQHDEKYGKTRRRLEMELALEREELEGKRGKEKKAAGWRAALQRKSHLCIPFLGISRPQPQFPRSCVCEGFIYFQDQSTYFLQQNSQTDRGNI